MEKRLHHVSKEKDRLTIFKGNTRSSSISVKNSELIPTDVIVEILLRLPVKSIAKFLCVSKDWASTLRSPYFTDLYVTMSSSRPRLLFSLKTERKWLFFSAPQPQNLNQNSSSSLAADYHMCFPTITCSHYDPVCGLICTKPIDVVNGGKSMVYNPSTGQSITLPMPRTRKVVVIRNYLGYDPINKQYKVLCMLASRNSFEAAVEHQVLTLGTEKPAWRMIDCSLPHVPIRDGICINGVLYYSTIKSTDTCTIVCFDVRSEKFKFIKALDNIVTWPSTLINYAGKLCVFRHHYVCGETKSLELWVLNDNENIKWSQHIYVLPSSWKNLVADTKLFIVGMTGNREIVFSPRSRYDPFYIFFYNVEKNTVVRVRIQGFESTSGKGIDTFIDHVEQVKRI